MSSLADLYALSERVYTVKKLNKALCAFLAALMLIPVSCLPARAAYTGDFIVEDGVLTKYLGNGGDVTIPGDLGITVIGKAFQLNPRITSITIPDGVTSIGEGAFEGCICLSSINIPGSVNYIGNESFLYCESLVSITLPEGVSVIDYGAFMYCENLETVQLPSSLRSIGEAVFTECLRLNSIVLPEGLVSIGGSAFFDCTALSQISIPDSVTEIGQAAFSNCVSLKWVSLPSGLTTVSRGLFSGCVGLFEVVLPESVTALEDNAFYGCSSLTSFRLPDAVRSIGSFAFAECKNLSGLTIPDGVASISTRTFSGCKGLLSVIVPESVTQFSDTAFSGCGSLVLYGIEDSYLRMFAKNYGFPFVPLSDTAVRPDANVLLDGVNTDLALYDVSGQRFVKLRGLAAALSGTAKQFDVYYDFETCSAKVETGKPYSSEDSGNQLMRRRLSVDIGPVNMMFDGKDYDLMAFNIDGSNYVRLDDISSLLNLGVSRSSGDTLILNTKPDQENSENGGA